MTKMLSNIKIQLGKGFDSRIATKNKKAFYSICVIIPFRDKEEIDVFERAEPFECTDSLSTFEADIRRSIIPQFSTLKRCAEIFFVKLYVMSRVVGRVPRWSSFMVINSRRRFLDPNLRFSGANIRCAYVWFGMMAADWWFLYERKVAECSHHVWLMMVCDGTFFGLSSLVSELHLDMG